MLEEIYNTISYDLDAPEKIPDRQKHFHSAVAGIIVYCLGFVTFGMGYYGAPNDNIITYNKAGTWMHLGTGPFLSASIMMNLWKQAEVFDNKKVGNMLGLLISVANAISLHWASSNWLGMAILSLMGYIIFLITIWIDSKGSIPLNEVLLCMRSSVNLFTITFDYDGVIRFAVGVMFVIVSIYINTFWVGLPIKSTKSRAQSTVQLKMMYNGITPLVMWQTFVESIAVYWRPDLGILSIPLYSSALFMLTISWHKWDDRMGKDIVERWKSENIQLRGYRSDEAAAKFINRTIEQLVVWNAIILVTIWLAGVYVPSTIGPTTALILTQIAKQYYQQS